MRKRLSSEKNYSSDMNDLAIGIDLGTTYCCAAVYRNGKVEIIPNSVGTNTTPSYVHIDKNNSVTAGTAAKGAAIQDPTTAAYDVKRLIGRRFNDPMVQKDMEIWPFKVTEDKDTHFTRIILNGTSYLPEQISAHVLEYLKKCAEEFLNCPIKKAVIAVPAYFTEAQRHATKLAGAMAGLEVLNLLHEPTAAAVTYCYKNKSFLTDKTILVFDLGGGTFDVVVMNIKDRKIQIKAIGGDSHLGGQDIDRNLVKHCLQEFKAKNGIDLNPIALVRKEVNVAKVLRRLKTECEEIKTQLSYTKKSVISLDNLHGDTGLFVKITREEFDNLNDSLFKQCVNTVKAVVRDAQLTPGDIDEVIMVGGSSRIPRLQELIMGLFPDKKPNKTINADEAVAYGSAIQAALMTVDCPVLQNIFPDIKIRDAISCSVDTKPFTTLATNTLNAESVGNDYMENPSPKTTVRTSKQVGNLESNGGKEIPIPIVRTTNQVEKPDEVFVKLQIIENGLFKKDTKVSAWYNVFKGSSIEKVAKEITSTWFNIYQVSYRAAWFISQILSDGEAAWTIESPLRTDVLSGIRSGVKRWEEQSIPCYSNDSMELRLRLLNVTHTTECQLFAAWSLKHYTNYWPWSVVPWLVKTGVLEILNKMRCEDEDVQKFVNMTLKLANDFLSL